MSNPFIRYVAQAVPKKRVQSISLELIAQDFEGSIRATDVQLQGGTTLSGWIPYTQEMFVRPRDSQLNIVPPKFFNALIRGQAQVIIPNTGGMIMVANPDGSATTTMPDTDPVTSPLDVVGKVVKGTTGALTVSTYYGTQTFEYDESLNAGDELEFSPEKPVTVNGNSKVQGPGTYVGVPMTVPYGDSIFQVNLHNRDAMNFLFTETEWNKASGVTW